MSVAHLDLAVMRAEKLLGYSIPTSEDTAKDDMTDRIASAIADFEALAVKHRIDWDEIVKVAARLHNYDLVS